MDIFKIVTLSLSGLLLTFVGLMRLTNPVKAYLKNSGIKLDNDASLLNEIRGVSAVQLFSGILILMGIFVSQLTLISFTIATLIFLGFAVGRLFSLSADGKPNKQIMQGIMFELVFGVLNVICLIYILN